MKSYQLKQKQSLSLEAKVIMTKRRIESFLTELDDKAYISYSGGIDSEVLRHIVLEVNPRLWTLFNQTGLQFPAIRRHATRFIRDRKDYREVVKYGYKQKYFDKEKLVIVYPKINLKEVFDKYGYPLVSKEQAMFIYEARNTNSEKLRNKRLYGDEKGGYKIYEKWKFLVDAPFQVSSKCCYAMKHGPFFRYEKQTGNFPITGEMVEESKSRFNTYIRQGGCNRVEGDRPISKPMSFWTKQDVLQYIIENDIKYCKEVYGDIIEIDGKLKTSKRQRTGCLPCGFGVHIDDTPNRFQRMEITNPKLHKYCMNELGMDLVLNYIGVEFNNTRR